MKKLLVLMLAAGLTTTASAQFKVRGYYPGPRVVVGVRPYIGLGYPYLAYPYGYPYFAPYGYAIPHPIYRPSKLDIQIETIRHDYDQRITAVKMDKNLKGRQRRQQIRQLKKDRDYQIDMARQNYFRS